MARILIVEDDAHVLRVLSMWLARHGHELLEARDGAQARDILAETDVHLMVSDVNMPRMSGTELVKWVREQKSESLPIVLLSSRCDQDTIAAGLREYGVRIHPKPFSPSRLVVEIKQLLARSAGSESEKPTAVRTD
ncbi:MAG: response regulator [Planctomycetota bacterium]|jgi:DNA-binding response OmpR family regulator